MTNKMPIIIRRLRKTDLVSLAELYRGFWNEDSDILKMDKMFTKLKKNKNYLFLVATIKNKLAGSVMAVVCDELYGNCKPFAVIEDMIVSPQYRKCGVGSALFSEVERILIEKGCTQMILVTETNRRDAQAFYESVGFTKGSHKGYKKQLIDRNILR